MNTPTNQHFSNKSLKEDDLQNEHPVCPSRVLVSTAVPLRHVAMVSPPSCPMVDGTVPSQAATTPYADYEGFPSSIHAKTAFVDCADVLQIIFEFIPNSRCLGAVQRVSTTWHVAFWNIEPQEHNLRTVIRHQVELLARAGPPYGSNDQIRDRVLLIKARLEVKKKARTTKVADNDTARTESEITTLPPIAARQKALGPNATSVFNPHGPCHEKGDDGPQPPTFCFCYSCLTWSPLEHDCRCVHSGQCS